ncbi:EAL domain-containing protein [Vibrio mediterranei]
MQLKHLTKTALDEDFFYPVIQPIVTLSDQSPISWEMLTRWDSAINFGCNVGELFSRIDDKTALEVTLAVLVKALQSLQHNPIHLNINVSSRHLLVFGAAERIIELARSFRYPLQLITIELTENYNSSIDFPKLNLALNLLNHNRMSVSLDDFGTAASTYERLFRIAHVSQIKLDRFFIESIETDTRKQKLLNHLVSYAPLFNAEIIAEGVETQSQAITLAECGIKHAQGYFFGRPDTLAKYSLELNGITCT